MYVYIPAPTIRPAKNQGHFRADLIAHKSASPAREIMRGMDMTMNAVRLKWRCQKEKVRATIPKIATQRPKPNRKRRYDVGMVATPSIAIERRTVKSEAWDNLKMKAVK